jgi:thiosulfate/3-mercaptopyruvate sulfurtransferase
MLDTQGFLIEPDELIKLLGGNLVLIDARPDARFKDGHIPGALPFSTYGLFADDTRLEGMKPFAEMMANRFMIAGVTLERPVVVYDDDTGMRAAREMWMLEFLGHRNVRMLHGGLNYWRRVGGPVLADTDVPTVRTKAFKPSLASGYLSSIDEVAHRGGTWNYWLLDVRDDLEWAGSDDTPCCARRGHVPHAKHIEWTQFLENGRFKSPEAIIALIEQQGINPRHDIAVYCHRGARSANTFYALRSAGIHSARNFIGSWHEWSARTDLPVETA